MKKFLCGLLTVATILPCAVACGGGEVDPNAGDGVSLKITAIDKGLGTAWLTDAAASFNRRNSTNITVVPDEGLNERVNNLITGKTGDADIYFTFSTEMQWVEWYAGGYVHDLQDINDKINYRDSEYAKLGVYDGKRIIMPYAYPPTGFVYNQNYVNEIPSYGAFTQGTFPTTWQGLLDMCYSIKNGWTPSTGKTVLPMSYGGSVGDMNYIFKSLWAQIDPAGFKAYYNQDPITSVANDENKNLLINNNVKQAVSKVVELINPQETNGSYAPTYADSNASAMSNLDAQSRFVNGFSVFTISGAWFEYEMRNIIAEQYPDENSRPYHFATAPIVNSGSQATTFINTPSEYFIIAKNGPSKNLELAKAFLKYLAKPDQAAIFHMTSGTPCAMQYEISNDDLTVFQAEIANVAATAQKAIGASDKIPSLSGILNVNFTYMFNQLATSAKSDATITSQLENLYADQKADWADSIGQFL